MHVMIYLLCFLLLHFVASLILALDPIGSRR